MSAALVSIMALFGQIDTPLIPIDDRPDSSVDAGYWDVDYIDDSGEKRSGLGYIRRQPGNMLIFYEERPWEASRFDAHNLRANEVELYNIGLERRRERLTEKMVERDYVTAGEFWAPRSMYRTSERARELYRMSQEEPEFNSTAPRQTASSPPPATGSPKPIQRWGLHAVVAIVGLAACGAVVRFLLLGQGG